MPKPLSGKNAGSKLHLNYVSMVSSFVEDPIPLLARVIVAACI